MLACRALEGWEEDVIYHGEVVATRRRFSDRLLLAHLARLDKLCGDAEVAEFADCFEDNLARYAAGEDRPARPPDEVGEGDENSSSGQWSTRSTQYDFKDVPEALFCSDCGGPCLGLAGKRPTYRCPGLDDRLDKMDAARPYGMPAPDEFPRGDSTGAIEATHLAAFEAGVEQWWRVVPAPEGADPSVWHYLEDS